MQSPTTLLHAFRISTRATRQHLAQRPQQLHQLRTLSTLSSNPHIYIHPDPSALSESYTLSYLSHSPPNKRLAIGSSSTPQPTPSQFSTNPSFLALLQQVLAEHAHRDPGLRAQAAAFASSSGSTLGSGGAFFAQPGAAASGSAQRGARHRSTPSYTAGGGGGAGGSGAGGASAQGGYGSGGHTGFMHVADERNPPAYGRIPEPEDIFGSLEVAPDGTFVDGHGHYQDSGTYRMLTREGCLGLSTFLRERLVERLKEEEQKDQNQR